MGPKEATARFYFQLTYMMAKEDVTKMRDVEKENLYLCLSVASIMKDNIEKQKMEIQKIKNENNSILKNNR